MTRAPNPGPARLVFVRKANPEGGGLRPARTLHGRTLQASQAALTPWHTRRHGILHILGIESLFGVVIGPDGVRDAWVSPHASSNPTDVAVTFGRLGKDFCHVNG